MGTTQSWNPRIKAYVKTTIVGGKIRNTNVKQNNPGTPFPGVPIRKRKP